jgi:integrase
MDDLLSPPVSAALLDWLGQAYGDLKRIKPDAPLWVCLSHRDWGKPVTTRGLGLIWQKHLGTSKVHTTRHTFARTMEDAGAKPSDITMRLAQDNPVSVARYLARLRREENQFADSLATLFGLSGGA